MLRSTWPPAATLTSWGNKFKLWNCIVTHNSQFIRSISCFPSYIFRPVYRAIFRLVFWVVCMYNCWWVGGVMLRSTWPPAATLTSWRNKFKSRVSRSPKTRVNILYATVGGGGAAGGHVDLNLTPPTHQQLYIQTTQKSSLKMALYTSRNM